VEVVVVEVAMMKTVVVQADHAVLAEIENDTEVVTDVITDETEKMIDETRETAGTAGKAGDETMDGTANLNATAGRTAYGKKMGRTCQDDRERSKTHPTVLPLSSLHLSRTKQLDQVPNPQR